jgi:hypothetical protein
LWQSRSGHAADALVRLRIGFERGGLQTVRKSAPFFDGGFTGC